MQTLYRLVLAGLAACVLSPALAEPAPAYRIPLKPLRVTDVSTLTYSASLSSESLSFNGCSSSSQQVLLTNTGTGALSLGSPLVSGAGLSASTSCAAFLAAGASCQTNVTWSPAGEGVTSGSVTFPSNATAGDSVVSVSATCEYIDPYWANVLVLFNAEGAGNQAVNAKGGLALTLYGSATNPFTAAAARYGERGLDGWGRQLMSARPASGFGTGDFTMEGWFKANPSAGYLGYAGLIGANGSGGPVVRFSGGALVLEALYQGGAAVLASASTVNQKITLANWQHIAVQRRSGVAQLFVDGVKIGEAPSSHNFSAEQFVIGGQYFNGNNFNGPIDDVRITQGVARYPDTGFTPAPAPTR